MLNPGRKPKAELLSFVPDVAEIRISPPAWLSKDEKKLFLELVNACRVSHFTPADEPVLIAFVQAVLLSRKAIRKADKDPAALVAWERATKIVAQLGTKLRLTPQSRINAGNVGRGRPSLPIGDAKPWEGCEDR